MEEYELIMSSTMNLLNNNKEWIKRYNEYEQKLNIVIKSSSNINDFLKKQKYFSICTNLSQILKNNNIQKFDIRIGGQNIFILQINIITKEIKLIPRKTKYANKILKDLNLTNEPISWSSNQGTSIRKYFRDKKEIDLNEHSIELDLKKKFNEKNTKNKPISNIQTINLCSFPFQMPTPIKASKVKNNNELKYSENGGGIDILARFGKGKGVKLAVFELKDIQNKTEMKKESPEIAIKQAIAYATFIRELLRNKSINNNAWWKLFGFNGNVPKKLVILTVIAIPNSENNNKDFAKKQIHFDGSEDYLELHYYYYNPNKLSESANTSLKDI